MKIAISGKGGVGKTTLAGALARHLADEGYRVLAIDADPDANLGSAIGVDPAKLAQIRPLASIRELVAERTGAVPGTFGGMFKMNPKVDDIPDEYSVEYKGIKLITLGTVPKGGSGCLCPEGTLLKTLMRHIMLQRNEAVIVDMEAGLEHLARGSTEGVDAFIVVVEPGQRAIQTAHQIKRLAADLGIKNTFVVGSKVREESDKKLVADGVAPLEVIGHIHLSEAIREADKRGLSPYDLDDDLRQQVVGITKKLESITAQGNAK